MPQPFFAKQLHGETPLSWESAQQLGDLAGRVCAFQPWQSLSESDLVFVRGAAGDLHVCSVMGALGEAFIVTAYQGLQGYHLYRKLQTLRTFTAGDFFAEQRSVFVEYEKPRGLTRPDRELLKALDYPAKRGGRLPQFRAVRPGYHPWYVTEEEALVLADCLRAMLLVCDELVAGRPAWWDVEGSYPLLAVTDALADEVPRFALEQFEPPPAADAVLAPPVLDPVRLQKLLARGHAPAGVLEVDQFYSGAKIGEKDQRKSLVRLVLAVDGKSGYVYPPKLGEPDAGTGQMLGDVILEAMEVGAPLPCEIRVRQARYRDALEPLARILHARVSVRKSLPALDHARDSVLGMLGDPGVIRMR